MVVKSFPMLFNSGDFSMKNQLLKRPLQVALGLIACWASGCSQGGPDLKSIRGVASHGGKPVPNLYLTFVPDDQMTKATSTAVTDSNGRFELAIGSTKGAFDGPHKVYASDPLAAVGSKSSDDPVFITVTKKYSMSPLPINIEKDEKNLELKFE
jgi:hypothetical protein